MRFLTVLAERWFGVRFSFSGDQLPRGERALIIANHRTRLDWMYLWSFCVRIGSIGALKIVLKVMNNARNTAVTCDCRRA